MKDTITDQQIIEGLVNKDSNVTKVYFYGYCRMAYYIYSKKYSLYDKPGMDFYSLAHEYYIYLDKHLWKPLTDRAPQTTLKTWMINGFRFLILDKLKAVEKEIMTDSLEERIEKTDLQFDIADNNFQKEVRDTVMEICKTYYGRDSISSIILQMYLIEGFKGKEIGLQLGMTPSAITQRYQTMMKSVVIPYFKNNFRMETPVGVFEESEVFENSRCYSASIMNDTNIIDNMKENRITPNNISSLQANEVFVFGSNLAGMHGGGAARTARLYFGAIMGKGVGMQGQSYAIPTMQGGVETIKPYVDDFIAFAKAHPEKKFLVTRIGCGIAGFDDEDIAPLFASAENVENISLPQSFWDEL